MGDELQELAEDIARGALNISWRDTESAARRVAEHSADRIGQLEREAQLQAQEIDKTRRRADKWQSMVLDCEEYLKPGETPRQRMDRDHADVLALLKLLEAEKRKAEQLEAERDAAYKRGLEDAARHWPCPSCGRRAFIEPGWVCSECGHIWSISEARALRAKMEKGEP